MSVQGGAGRTAYGLALRVVQQLWLAGVRDVVLAPGSRSAPVALVLHAADEDGDLRLHVRVDERSAGFLALGLTTGSRRPVAVVTTSGTAVGNLLPAVMEAHHSGRRLVVVSADRPERLRGTGANQTTEQAGIFGVFAASHDLTADASDEQLRSVVGDGVRTCRCHPAEPAARRRPAAARPRPRTRGGTVRRPPSRSSRPPSARAAPLTPTSPSGGPRPVRGVSWASGRGPWWWPVTGPGPAARLLAEAANWPLVAEPTSGARIGRQALRTGRLLLTTDLRGDVERVVVMGHPTLSRPVTALLSDPALEVVAVRGPDGVATDPGRVARVLDEVPTVQGPDDPTWHAVWRDADDRLGALIDASLPAGSPLAVAAAVGRAVVGHASLVVGSSNPVRDLDVMATPWPPNEHRFVIGNRGLAGIDGVVSTAVGVALGRPGASRTIAFVGDLTFLHDANGLLAGPREPRPDLTLVVLNDDGGAIFATLEQGDPRYASAFERVFGTPHGTDLEALCAAHHTTYERIEDVTRLAVALEERVSGIRVLEVPVSRTDRRAEAAWLRGLARQVVPHRDPRR